MIRRSIYSWPFPFLVKFSLLCSEIRKNADTGSPCVAIERASAGAIDVLDDTNIRDVVFVRGGWGGFLFRGLV